MLCLLRPPMLSCRCTASPRCCWRATSAERRRCPWVWWGSSGAAGRHGVRQPSVPHACAACCRPAAACLGSPPPLTARAPPAAATRATCWRTCLCAPATCTSCLPPASTPLRQGQGCGWGAVGRLWEGHAWGVALRARAQLLTRPQPSLPPPLAPPLRLASPHPPQPALAPAPPQLEEVERLAGKDVAIETTSAGGVKWREVDRSEVTAHAGMRQLHHASAGQCELHCTPTALHLPPPPLAQTPSPPPPPLPPAGGDAGSGKRKKLSVKIPKWCGKWAVGMDAFKNEVRAVRAVCADGRAGCRQEAGSDLQDCEATCAISSPPIASTRRWWAQSLRTWQACAASCPTGSRCPPLSRCAEAGRFLRGVGGGDGGGCGLGWTRRVVVRTHAASATCSHRGALFTPARPHARRCPSPRLKMCLSGPRTGAWPLTWRPRSRPCRPTARRRSWRAAATWSCRWGGRQGRRAGGVGGRAARRAQPAHAAQPPKRALPVDACLPAQVTVPAELQSALKDGMAAAGIPVPDSPEKWQQALDALKVGGCLGCGARARCVAAGLPCRAGARALCPAALVRAAPAQPATVPPDRRRRLGPCSRVT